MSREKQIEEKTCETCLHYCACLINSEYHPERPCCVYKDKANYRKQSEGEWRDRGIVKSVNPANIPIVECSKCNITFCDILNNHHLIYRYCPFCGAKMKGGADNG